MMGRGRFLALLFAALILGSGVSCTTQGPQEQLRPAENQSSEAEDKEEKILETPEKGMEETANEEQKP